MQHYINVIARSDLSAEAQRAKAEATKQSNLSFCCEMDCFACARNDGSGCLKTESELGVREGFLSFAPQRLTR